MLYNRPVGNVNSRDSHEVRIWEAFRAEELPSWNALVISRNSRFEHSRTSYKKRPDHGNGIFYVVARSSTVINSGIGSLLKRNTRLRLRHAFLGIALIPAMLLPVSRLIFA